MNMLGRVKTWTSQCFLAVKNYLKLKKKQNTRLILSNSFIDLTAEESLSVSSKM